MGSADQGHLGADLGKGYPFSLQGPQAIFKRGPRPRHFILQTPPAGF